MTFLETELRRRKIPFLKSKRRIRCFPHIVNLTCQAVLGVITDMDFAAPEAADFVPRPADAAPTFMDTVRRDPVATVRTTVRVIRASSLRRQYFSDILKALQQKDLQLLRDVNTRWSSTLLMIDRAVLLREVRFSPACNFSFTVTFTGDRQVPFRPPFRDLHKYKLRDNDWDALKAFQRILAVPHAFQQKLSAEKTPTLGHALPAFEAMISAWQKQQLSHPETADIVQKGIDKLESYRDRVKEVPVYILSMLINPAVKLRWFEKHWPERVQEIKDLFLHELRPYRTNLTNTPARASQNSWADEVLGMDTPDRPTHSQNLADEVQSYFTEASYHLGSVRYWEESQLRYPT
ncbi:ribonuclease H-like domain-containing protein, partial [Mycena sp. CBHHK59/15]